METLKYFVTTLVTVLIFMSAVELLSPDNKMKKYIKFVLGLILVTVILTPITQFLSKGENSIINGIDEYTKVFSQESQESRDIGQKYNSILNGDENKSDARKKAFVDNFDDNCKRLLKEKFPDKQFTCEIDCDVDFTEVKLDIKKLEIGVGDDKHIIKPIKKVEITKEEKEVSQDDKSEFNEIKDYISQELEISKDKIDVHKIEE